MERAYLLYNVSTSGKTQSARRDSSTRTKVVAFNNGALRLMPHRPYRVTQAWLEAQRKQVLDFQRKGLLEVRTQENVAFELPETGDIPYPIRAPKPFPKPPSDLPPELRGEVFFDPFQKADASIYPPLQGWQGRHPLETSTETAPSAITAKMTGDAAFPEDLFKAEAPAPEQPSSAAFSTDDLGDLEDLLSPEAATVPWDLPPEMVLKEGEGEDQPLFTEAAPPEEPSIPAPTPAPGGNSGGRRKRRGR